MLGWLLGILAVAGGPAAHGVATQSAGPFPAIGVVYDPAPDAQARRRDLEEIQRLRFTVVAIREAGADPAAARVLRLDSLLAGDTEARAAVRAEGPTGHVEVRAAAAPAQVAVEAWAALSRGARTVLFDDWAALRADRAAIEAAADFAGHVSRNAALYAALGPRGGPEAVRVEGADGIHAAFLESPDALVLIAVNRTAAPQQATLAFSPDAPEAIWQNMLTGASVNFVAGPAGPTYTYTFAPHDVLVLMIQKRWR